MSLIKSKKEGLWPSLDAAWDDLFGNDFFKKGIELGTTIPPVNVTEDDKKYRMEVAIPGYKKEDFKVNLDENVLTISSEKKDEKEEKNEKVTRREFNYSSFQRSFTLPENVDKQKIDAKYVDGILSFDLPKLHNGNATSKKTIEVK